MERRYPLIDIGAEVAERLLRTLPGTSRPCALELLEGGHINTNYVVSFDDGQRVVLRICAQGEATFRKEVEVLRALHGSVPVPRVYMAVFEPQFFEYPYSVLEWIEGRALNEALSSCPGAASEIGEAVASILLRIGEHVLPAYSSFSFVEFIRECLFERGAARYLGTETSARLWALVQKQSGFLNELCRVEALVHGDFQGDNILIQEKAGRWQVVGVLDWEWARNGCYLRDLGSLLRFEGEASTAFQHGLGAGFSRCGAPLPREWKSAARIWDMAAHCEKLAYPRHRGEVTFRSIRIIERCLKDFSDLKFKI
jgi:aminoglycoside phosphotransferase (APT) family kinase protein